MLSKSKKIQVKPKISCTNARISHAEKGNMQDTLVLLDPVPNFQVQLHD